MAGPAGHPGELRATDRAASAQPAQSASRPPELRAPLGSTAWADELGARVTWMIDRGEQVASLRLSPENLGPVEVRIAVREGETSVWFGAAHADTRAALEQSLSRLRDMLGASGLSLADAGVSSQTPRDPQRGFTAAALARAAQESGADPSGGIVMQVSRRGLVDLYA
jgi:flagellar hook-length control protein FliK